MKYGLLVLWLAVFAGLQASAQIPKAPLKKEGAGPYAQLILRGGILINGTGTPAYGPVDIIVENNR